MLNKSAFATVKEKNEEKMESCDTAKQNLSKEHSIAQNAVCIFHVERKGMYESRICFVT